MRAIRNPATITNRKDEIKWLKSLPYDKYLKSNHWQKKRKAAVKRAKCRCQLCNKTGKLFTHHRTYERLGQERNEDLFVLCGPCHDKFHDVLPKFEDRECPIPESDESFFISATEGYASRMGRLSRVAQWLNDHWSPSFAKYVYHIKDRKGTLYVYWRMPHEEWQREVIDKAWHEVHECRVIHIWNGEASEHEEGEAPMPYLVNQMGW